MVEQAVSLNPNLAIAWNCRGWVALMCGEFERAIESFDRMIRLSPLDPLTNRCMERKVIRTFSFGPLRGRACVGDEITSTCHQCAYAGGIHHERRSCRACCGGEGSGRATPEITTRLSRFSRTRNLSDPLT